MAANEVEPLIRVEFTSPSSGAYIHEMTDKIEMHFKDKDGDNYVLTVKQSSGRVENINTYIDIDLLYPDGSSLTLEQVWAIKDE